MRVVRGLQRPEGLRGALFLAIGNFDGVHRGHQALIRALVAEAGAAGATPAVLTFEPHVRQVLEPDVPLPLLTPMPDRLRLLAALGVEWAFVAPFTRQLANVEADAFARDVLAGRLGVRRVFVGPTFTFGRGGLGTPETLAACGRDLGFDVRVVGPVRVGGRPVSSTAVREALAAGRVEEAAAMLGRPHVVEGTVVPGAGRGRGLGVPTANVAVEEGVLLPAPGVYAVEACAPGTGPLPGVANLGWRPTFGDVDRPVLEVHLLDRELDVTGARLRVAFRSRLREERRFPGPAALREQIRADVEAARRALAAPADTALGREGWGRYLCGQDPPAAPQGG